MGHAVTMVGYDNNPVNFRIRINDPANNAGGVHNWPGENAWYGLAVNANDLTINLGGNLATIYGATITSLVPAPGVRALLGVAGVLCTSRRRRGPISASREH